MARLDPLRVRLAGDGKDPDDLILESPDRWREVIAAAKPVIEHALDGVARENDIATAQGKAAAAEALVPLLLDIADPIQRSHYVELSAQRLHVDSQSLNERLRAARGRTGVGGQGMGVSRTRPRSNPQPLAPNPQSPNSSPTAQEYAVALVVAAVQRGLPHPSLDASDFSDPSSRALVLRIAEPLQSARGDWR
ncbi:MAG: hypothetical protein E6J45_14925, partial [Chloroflexi bacterium]